MRDFYPDLPKLHAQAEFLDALEKNDIVKLREIHGKYGPKRSRTVTPGNICEYILHSEVHTLVFVICESCIEIGMIPWE